MQGVRRDIDGTEWTTAKAWDYGKMTNELGWEWYCVVPSDAPYDEGCMFGNLSQHSVTEHEDGTITVSPSILIGQGKNNTTPWHGYLEHGVWREV